RRRDSVDGRVCPFDSEVAVELQHERSRRHRLRWIDLYLVVVLPWKRGRGKKQGSTSQKNAPRRSRHTLDRWVPVINPANKLASAAQPGGRIGYFCRRATKHPDSAPSFFRERLSPDFR